MRARRDEWIAAGVFDKLNLPAEVGGERIYMVSQLFPRASPDTSHTIQNILATFVPDEAQLEAIREQMQFLFAVVRDEDYYTGNRIQLAVKTAAKDHFLYGRNELGGQRFHQWVGDLVEAVDDEAYLNLLNRAEVQFHA